MMHHRSALRAQADLPVTVYADGYVFDCRTADVSTQGMRLASVGGLAHHALRSIYLVEFPLGDGTAIAIARPAWWRGDEAAFRFISMADCDRLSIAEQMDASAKRGLAVWS